MLTWMVCQMSKAHPSSLCRKCYREEDRLRYGSCPSNNLFTSILNYSVGDHVLTIFLSLSAYIIDAIVRYQWPWAKWCTAYGFMLIKTTCIIKFSEWKESICKATFIMRAAPSQSISDDLKCPKNCYTPIDSYPSMITRVSVDILTTENKFTVIRNIDMGENISRQPRSPETSKRYHHYCHLLQSKKNL